MNKSILLITTMYPNSLRPSTPVCHYFTRQWKAMGHNVVVIYFRSVFPAVFIIAARLFPKLALRFVGNHVELDNNRNVLCEDKEGIPVYSIPIFKFLPHGRYPKRSINKGYNTIKTILTDLNYDPNVIIGHFYNPQFEIVGLLKSQFPKAKTAVVLHELSMKRIRQTYHKDLKSVFNRVDSIGFRSIPIRDSFIHEFGEPRNYFLCWSGTSSAYIDNYMPKLFSNSPLSRFIFVGQTIKRKHPRETVEALYSVYGNNGFSLDIVGSRDIAYEETNNYVEERGLDKNVSFVGKIPRDEIIAHYDNAECFILISSNEVFGLVYLEAMARGCITIASRGEGMEGIIHHGENGFLCRSGDAHELAEIIRHINSLTAEEKARISQAGRKTAEALSDYNVAKSYLECVLTPS